MSYQSTRPPEEKELYSLEEVNAFVQGSNRFVVVIYFYGAPEMGTGQAAERFLRQIDKGNIVFGRANIDRDVHRTIASAYDTLNDAWLVVFENQRKVFGESAEGAPSSTLENFIRIIDKLSARSEGCTFGDYEYYTSCRNGVPMTVTFTFTERCADATAASETTLQSEASRRGLLARQQFRNLPDRRPANVRGIRFR
ncbi:hypothetical protein TWF281_005544 [Arthrobotrys megalospora]